MKFYKKHITQVLFTIAFFIISSIAVGQIQNPYLHTLEEEDQPTVNVEQEKQKFKEKLQNQIDQTEDVIYMIETQYVLIEDKMTDEFKKTVDKFETSLKLYKNNLINQKDLIENQSNEEWEIFKARTENWWSDVEAGLHETIDQVEEEYTEFVQ